VRRPSVSAIITATAVLAAVPAGVSFGDFPAGTAPAHVAEAVESIFELDESRVDADLLALEAQDVVRQEVTVCIDPVSSTLSGRSRLWIESDAASARLMLNARLEVLGVNDSRGDSLRFTRNGDGLVVHAREGADGFPLEIAVAYEGTLVSGVDAWVSEEVVALGAGFLWYPVSEGRDPARLRIEARYPTGYSSVASGTLAGMATSIAGDVCAEGDVWEVPTPVTNAGIVVGSFESSLTVTGDVFFGHHVPYDPEASFSWTPSPSSAPKELVDLLPFLEACYGPYPYEWLNIVRLPGRPSRPVDVITAPGLVVVRASEGAGEPTRETLGKVVSGLARSWWTYWMDPGPMLSESLANAAEVGWHDATGDQDRAARLRGVLRSGLMMALREAGRDVSLRDCAGVSPSADARICEGKGTAALEMLQSVVGGAYCSALRAVAAERGGGTVALRTFAEAMEREHGGDLDWFFYEWMARGDLPSYAFEYETAQNGDGTYTVRGVVHQEGEPFRTPLPLTVDLGGWAYDETIEIASAHQTFEIWAEAKPMRIVIDERGLVPKVNREELAAFRHASGGEAAADGDWGRAVDELGAAAALEPLNPVYALDYARALVRHGLAADGLAAMRLAVELDPDNHELLLEAAQLHTRSGDHESAVALLDAYVEAEPGQAVGHVRRGRALIELGRVDAGEAELDIADELTGGTCFAPLEEEKLVAYGRLYEKRGDALSAARAYEAALAVNPVSDEARRLLRTLDTAPSE